MQLQQCSTDPKWGIANEGRANAAVLPSSDESFVLASMPADECIRHILSCVSLSCVILPFSHPPFFARRASPTARPEGTPAPPSRLSSPRRLARRPVLQAAYRANAPTNASTDSVPRFTLTQALFFSRPRASGLFTDPSAESPQSTGRMRPLSAGRPSVSDKGRPASGRREGGLLQRCTNLTVFSRMRAGVGGAGSGFGETQMTFRSNQLIPRPKYIHAPTHVSRNIPSRRVLGHPKFIPHCLLAASWGPTCFTK